MKREDYLQGDVALFTSWLAERLCGQPIHFSVRGQEIAFRTLCEALNGYCWPLKKLSGRPNPDGHRPYIHPNVPTLSARSNLAANTDVLSLIRKALHNAYSAPGRGNELSGAVAAVFHWGGVYTKRGNGLWLERNHLQLASILQKVVNDHALGEDLSAVDDLRFNSGMTKVYSLLINDFIIYDSRVAASLAWLVLLWWDSVVGRPREDLPSLLRFGCLPGNGKAQHQRNPDRTVFRTLASNPGQHYLWNIRANWVLVDAMKKAGAESSFSSLREIEAALFQMGARVV